ncbi:MAG: hypothetical protein R3C15_13550 [Thermoleophilia bacterium]
MEGVSRNPFRRMGIGGLIVLLVLGGLVAGAVMGIVAIVDTARSDTSLSGELQGGTALRPDHPRSLFFEVNLLPALQRVGREVGREGDAYGLRIEPGGITGAWRLRDDAVEQFRLGADGVLARAAGAASGDPIPLDRLDPTVPEKMIVAIQAAGGALQDIAYFAPVWDEGNELLEWLAVMDEGVTPARYRSDELGQIVRPA